jgi:hypothetical protein
MWRRWRGVEHRAADQAAYNRVVRGVARPDHRQATTRGDEAAGGAVPNSCWETLKARARWLQAD